MAKVNRYHVISRHNKWAVKREGSSRAAGVFQTKNEATKVSERFQKQDNDVVIHNEDGTISAWHRGKK